MRCLDEGPLVCVVRLMSRRRPADATHASSFGGGEPARAWPHPPRGARESPPGSYRQDCAEHAFTRQPITKFLRATGQKKKPARRPALSLERLVRGGAVVVDALLDDATARAATRREDEHGHEQTDDTNHHEDDADRLDADAGQRRVDGEGENRADSDEENADADTHDLFSPVVC